MANTTADDWDINSPANEDNASSGDDEIRVLREGVEQRIKKEHVQPAGSNTGGEHLEGSARVHTATSAPTVIVVGGANISGNEALAEGIVWANTGNGYVLQVYASSAWRDVGYLPLAGGTTTGAITFGAAININADSTVASTKKLSGTGGGVQGNFQAQTDSSNGVGFSATCISGNSGSGYDATCASGSTGSGLNVLVQSGSTADCIKLAQSGGNAHINMSGDPANSSPTDGDVWFDGSDLKIRIGSTTYTLDKTAV
jgi:hypothetical protein